MKKALITTTTPYMIRQFLMDDIGLLKSLGYDVEIATNFKTFNIMTQEVLDSFSDQLAAEGIKINQISFTNKIYDISSLFKSYFELKKLFDANKYSLIHTHTPIAGFITRIAYKDSTLFPSTKMLYTAHGFHFFKGNSVFKNIIFKNIERFAAKYSDRIITINEEDYQAAKSFKLKDNGSVFKIPGVGIDLNKIQSIAGNKKGICKELGISDSSTLIVSVGELKKRKNHELIIRALTLLPDNYHYLICGTGDLLDDLKKLAQSLKLENRVHFLGFRTNVIEIVKSCDVFAFPSFQEGLPVALMEALACNIPCVASNIRGNSDLISDNNGVLLSLDNAAEWADVIKSIAVRKTENNDMNKYDYHSVAKYKSLIYKFED